MSRRLILVILVFAAPLLSGCLVARTTGAVAGAAVGAAGEVAEGAVDIVTPDGDDDEDGEEGDRRR